VLGFGAGQVQKIPSDSDYRLDVAKLRRAIRRDRAQGLTPFCIVATAGTTNTGSIDPLDLLADLAEEEDLWLHVDGALGAAAVLDPRGRRLLSGIERADSLVLDPHKWLFQPFEMGCMLVRETGWLEKAFRIAPEYLSDTQTRGDEVNFWERGIQHSRRFRALKLWLSVNIFGWSAFRQAVQRGFELAELAEALVREHEDWQIVTPAQLAILTFRYASPRMSERQLDDINRALVEDLIADGSAMISSTVVRERTVLRMCTINPRTTDSDMRATIACLAALADRRVRGGQHTGQ
jgi:glutamate/tyrosine decarboxylase-like PLP-dependent enzyme